MLPPHASKRQEMMPTGAGQHAKSSSRTCTNPVEEKGVATKGLVGLPPRPRPTPKSILCMSIRPHLTSLKKGLPVNGLVSQSMKHVWISPPHLAEAEKKKRRVDDA